MLKKKSIKDNDNNRVKEKQKRGLKRDQNIKTSRDSSTSAVLQKEYKDTGCIFMNICLFLPIIPLSIHPAADPLPPP